jgi:hypothetical protein
MSHCTPEYWFRRAHRENFRSGHFCLFRQHRSFSTEALGSAARPTSASPRKLTSGPNEKLVGMAKRLMCCSKNSGGDAARSTRMSISLRSSAKLIGFVRSASAPFSKALRFVSIQSARSCRSPSRPGIRVPAICLSVNGRTAAR